ARRVHEQGLPRSDGRSEAGLGPERRGAGCPDVVQGRRERREHRPDAGVEAGNGGQGEARFDDGDEDRCAEVGRGEEAGSTKAVRLEGCGLQTSAEDYSYQHQNRCGLVLIFSAKSAKSAANSMVFSPSRRSMFFERPRRRKSKMAADFAETSELLHSSCVL